MASPTSKMGSRLEGLPQSVVSSAVSLSGVSRSSVLIGLRQKEEEEKGEEEEEEGGGEGRRGGEEEEERRRREEEGRRGRTVEEERERKQEKERGGRLSFLGSRMSYDLIAFLLPVVQSQVNGLPNECYVVM